MVRKKLSGVMWFVHKAVINTLGGWYLGLWIFKILFEWGNPGAVVNIGTGIGEITYPVTIEILPSWREPRRIESTPAPQAVPL